MGIFDLNRDLPCRKMKTKKISWTKIVDLGIVKTCDELDLWLESNHQPDAAGPIRHKKQF